VAAPFWILSGGTYSLAKNQSQTVKVVFSPGSSGSYTQALSFSGALGTNVTLSGRGTNSAGVPPTLSPIAANLSNLGTNPAVLEIAPGATLQLSATASGTNGNALAWQWLNSVNGGAASVYQVGSGNSPAASFTTSASVSGNTYAWTLLVTDTRTGLSSQAQITTYIQLLPPTGMQVQAQ
jgi:hypothetical protein